MSSTLPKPWCTSTKQPVCNSPPWLGQQATRDASCISMSHEDHLFRMFGTTLDPCLVRTKNALATRRRSRLLY